MFSGWVVAGAFREIVRGEAISSKEIGSLHYVDLGEMQVTGKTPISDLLAQYDKQVNAH